MMQLELKNVASLALYVVGADGAVLGRDRERTEITLEHESVSKRHAQISLRNGVFYLEDLDSSNGTYVSAGVVTSPVPLSAGMAFWLAQQEFLVLRIEEEGQVSSTGNAKDSSREDSLVSMVRVENAGWLSFLINVRTGLGRYAAALVGLLLFPFRVIRKFGSDASVPVMSGAELAALACVATVFIVALGPVLAWLVAPEVVVPRSFALSAVRWALAPAIALVGGAFFHSIAEWMIKDVWHGRSTPSMRTTCFVMGCAFLTFASIPSSLRPIFGADWLLPAMVLLTGWTAAVGIMLAHRWCSDFQLDASGRWTVMLAVPFLLVAQASFAVMGHGIAVRAESLAPMTDASIHQEKPRIPAKNTEASVEDAGVHKGLQDKPTDEQSDAISTKEKTESSPVQVASAELLERLRNGRYDQYASRVAYIERALDNFPEWLKDDRVRSLYQEIWRVSRRIEKKRPRKKLSRFEEEKVLPREHRWKIMNATESLVFRLEQMLRERESKVHRPQQGEPTSNGKN
jgi:hypothetical protein